MKTFASICTGGGLADVGAMMAGYTPIWGIEIDEAIAEVAEFNLKHKVICKSVLDVAPSTLERPDVLWTSPPCQSFSCAKANGQELDGDIAIAQAIVDFISTLQPPVFILENVEGYKRSKSLKFIEGALYALGYWVDRQVINAADWGVPQTRKRLILRAVLGGFPPPLPPKEKWVGWYEAIADLIPALPASRLADWQIARLPESLVSILIDGQNARTEEKGGLNARDTRSPSFTISSSASERRAVLVESKNANQQYGDGLREEFEPATTVITDHKPSHLPKAILVGDQKTGKEGVLTALHDRPSHMVDTRSASKIRAVLIDSGQTIREATTREGDEPAYTITADKMRRPISSPKTILISGTGDRGETVSFREGHEPSLTVTKSSDRQVARAWMETGRVVAMTPRALARFQTLPDWYELPEKNALACRIIGNGVPCLLVEKLLKLFD